jgi:hypothetical protein
MCREAGSGDLCVGSFQDGSLQNYDRNSLENHISWECGWPGFLDVESTVFITIIEKFGVTMGKIE